MVAGVASGLGRYFAVDPTLVRVVFAVTGLLTGGLALLAYPIMWFLMPEEPAGAPAWPHAAGDAPQDGPPPTAGPRPAGRRSGTPRRRPTRRRPRRATPPAGVSGAHSHSMVPGGLLVTSSTTRLTSGTSLVIRVEIRAITS